MTKAIISTFMLTFLLTNAIAQKNTYIGGEGAINNDIYDIIDDGYLLKKGPLITGYFGINIRQDLSSSVFAETDAISCWLIPLRLPNLVLRRRTSGISKHLLKFRPTCLCQ